MNISRRTFVGSSLLAAPAVMTAAAAPRQNVLFIATDDLCNRTSCYGHPIVKTPNIDRIAASGVRFDRSYCQFPWCSPSRSSLMTGLAPDTTKVWDLTTHFRKALPDVVTLPQVFQKNGYFTARAGKIYHYGNPGDIGTPGLDDAPSWNETVNPAGIDHTKEEDLLTNFTPPETILKYARGITGPGGAPPQLPPGVSPRSLLGAAIAFHKSESPDNLQTDYLVADAVIAMMEKHRKDPWFLGSGFYKPHVPWIVPSKYFDMYPLDNIDVAPFDESEMNIGPHWAYSTIPSNWGLTVPQRREAIRAYYASASFLDAQVGRVLDAMERLGLAQNTTTVFWADHGWQLGEHGQWQKQTLFEPSARVPLLIGGAGVRAAGKGCGRTVEHLDIYPTLVEMCGLQGAPSGLHGRSLAPLLANPNAHWDRPAISQVSRKRQDKTVMGYSIRTEQHRYTIWTQGGDGEELYDYKADPREMHNLASASHSIALKKKLRASLEQICLSRGMASSFGTDSTA
jgi:uncharacterized sulfatase